MGSSLFHRDKALHNKELCAQISPGTHADWLGTVAFYAALHCIEMLFARAEEFHSRGHQERLRFLLARYPSIYKEYHPLFNFSLVARYHDSPLPIRNVQHEITEKRLPRLEGLVERELAALKEPRGGGGKE